MSVSSKRHLAERWRVHELASDFKLLDVWRFGLPRAPRDFDRFVGAVWGAFDEVAASTLSRLRLWLGERFGWDEKPGALAIPGCSEHWVAERMSVSDRAGSRPAPMPVAGPEAGLRAVYRFENEALYEVSNSTIHALIHLGWGGSQRWPYT